MTNESERLKPCERCGGIAVMRRDDDPRYPFYVTFEHEPACIMYAVPTDLFRSFESEQEAVAAWNRRAYPKPCDLHETYARGCSHCHDVNGFMPMCGRCDAPPTPSREASEEKVIALDEIKAIAANAVQAACEADIADPGHPNTIAISVDEFEAIVRCAVENWAETRAAAIQSREDALREALEGFCNSSECAAGCDEGANEDTAFSEILSSMGSAMGLAYINARAALNSRGAK